MDISIRAVDAALTHTLRSSIEERLACALARTERQSARLGVPLPRTAGPGRQLLQCCQMHVQFRDARKFVVADIKTDFQVAAERAAKRVDRLLRQAAPPLGPRPGQHAAARAGGTPWAAPVTSSIFNQGAASWKK
jgi:hypothetical protein